MACKVCIKRNLHNDRVVGGQPGRPSNTVIKGKKSKRNTKIDKKSSMRMHLRFGMKLIVGPETRPIKRAVYTAALSAYGRAGAVEIIIVND